MEKVFFRYFVSLFVLLHGLPHNGAAQVSLNGPVCVLPGLTYQYTITGQWDSASTMQVCVSGGKIAGSAGSCTANSVPIGYVLVIWDSVQNGAVQLSSSAGNSNLAITISSALQGGFILASSRSQVVTYNMSADTIHCSASTGGSCTPHILYQWQQSPDMVNWVDIPGITTQDCLLPAALQQTLYCRRRTTETVSSLITYSDIAMVAVSVPIPTTSN